MAIDGESFHVKPKSMPDGGQPGGGGAVAQLVGPIQRLALATRALLGRDPYAARSWSQEGEDLLLCRYFEDKRDGFFVDVGAHHPMRFSNTYMLYRRGWRGINIDAAPGSMAAFRVHRSLDTNIECAIGTGSADLPFFIFNETALNTFDEALARDRESRHSRYRIERVVRLKTRRLADVLADHVPPGVAIDLLTVDAEGWDLEVLRSNDWQRYRPAVVLVESLGGASVEDVRRGEANRFLAPLGYEIHAKTYNTVLFRRV